MKRSKLPVVYGVIIALGLIAHFMLLSIFGLHTNPMFSLFNGVIMAAGMFIALKRYKQEKGSQFKYEKGFVASLFTGFNATLIFTLFFVFYSSIVSPNFISELIGSWSSHYHTSEGLVIFVVFVMGLATTMILTLTYMQLFKPTWNTTSASKKAFELHF